jgi:hypothetical protein
VASPSVALSTWLLAGFDPVLIAVAVYLGWSADQVGKIVIAAIAALTVSLLVAWNRYQSGAALGGADRTRLPDAHSRSGSSGCCLGQRRV